jgi:hypothetical protein
VPSQQRVRRGDRRDFAQGRTAEPKRAGDQPSAIVVGETQPTATKLTPQQPVLFDQVRDRLALTTVEPPREHAPHHLQGSGVDHEAQLISQLHEETSIALWHSTGAESACGRSDTMLLWCLTTA